jgi:hypothetical protein
LHVNKPRALQLSCKCSATDPSPALNTLNFILKKLVQLHT